MSAVVTPDSAAGQAMHDFIAGLFPICRSLTGAGTRQTLAVIAEHLPGLRIHSVPSGTQVFDWSIPDEWNIRSARLIGPGGDVIVDFAAHNLHVVGYSEPVDEQLSLEELQPHLHSRPDLPDAIPYVTSYYRRYWGFCMTQRQRDQLQPGMYRAVIDSTLAPGVLNYGEIVIPGSDPREVFLSTYVCHPSMANNELSGPAVAVWLAKWLCSAPRRFTYRLVFIPETIGSITYLSRNLERMKKLTLAGFNISCVGDERSYSFLPSRLGNTISDRVARHVLKHFAPDYVSYSFKDRGSDERQYCSPGVDLPVASVMRTKYTAYPEYHTSLDDLTLVTPAGLAGALKALQLCLECLEANDRFTVTVKCEPQMGRRGLYPMISSGNSAGNSTVGHMMHVLAYSDGAHDLIDIADDLGVPVWGLYQLVDKLKADGLLAASELTNKAPIPESP